MTIIAASQPSRNMSAPKSLTFTTLPKIGADPTLDRRANLIARLEEQKLLPKDSNYTRTVRIWMKKDGQLTPVNTEGLALVAANGSYLFFIRSGSRPIEFEKGKNAIAVPSLDRVPLVIDILITAVRNGELDDQLAQTKKLLTAATSRYSAGADYSRVFRAAGAWTSRAVLHRLTQMVSSVQANSPGPDGGP
jgi:hypothetical protein